MKNESDTNSDDLNVGHQNMTALEDERKKSREETLTWLSQFALARVRLAWRSQPSACMLTDSVSETRIY
jgi:hypothetical protein